ncbi:MAG TPA: lysylphosphatidylglycerol synthase transmembrane domain-containing protein [Verrucomicrobiae bacterium]|nr:lysylphosphatidylglycerol synthase transmembrane domain-containing protein [Verrucomicrobiae bacterium]
MEKLEILPAAAPRPKRRAHRVVLQVAFNLLVTGSAVWFLWTILADIGLKAVGLRLLRADAFLVGLLLVANVARFLLLALRWEILVRREAPVGFRATLEILMAGNFVGVVAPGLRVAGPVLRAFYLSKETGKPRARFYGTIVADQTTNFSAFTAVMIASGMLTMSRGEAGLSVSSGLALLFALVGGLYVGWRHLRRIRGGETSYIVRALRAASASRAAHALGGRWDLGGRFIRWWEHLLEALAEAFVGSRTFWPSMAVSFVLLAVIAESLDLSMRAVGSPIGLAKSAFAVSAAAFIQMMAAAPGGPGVTEASMVIILLALGVDVESAAAGTFLSRIFNYGVILPWGGYCFYHLQKEYGPAPEEDEDEAENS